MDLQAREKGYDLICITYQTIEEVVLGEVERRVPTPDLRRLETVSLGVG